MMAELSDKSHNKKRMLVMAGGTGGHIFPALAVAAEMKKQGWDLCWLGAQGKMEEKLVPQYGLPLKLISIQGIRGGGWLRFIAAPFKIAQALVQSLRIVKQYKPDVVLGMGGFVTGPGGLAARLFRVPLVIHEQNAIAGTTNRILSWLAADVLSAFPDTFGHHQVVVVGNPIRQELLALHQQRLPFLKGQPLKILVVGGSLGAQIFNQVLPDTIACLQSQRQGQYQVFHQAGKGNQEAVLAAYKQNDVVDDVVVEEFIDDMARAYQWADMIVCRAGALTVSELAVMGLPSILVPYPHAIDDHQTRNAQFLAAAGAALIMPQTEFNSTALAAQILHIAQQEDKLTLMSEAAYRLAEMHAAENVAAICCKAAKSF
jgi:UDP-N-acetylglucosamine--N-acetylmuramyl-(pentapeptide) pyrophosphoryl-undecaprenol N-acetylglucosamine transferase